MLRLIPFMSKPRVASIRETAVSGDKATWRDKTKTCSRTRRISDMIISEYSEYKVDIQMQRTCDKFRDRNNFIIRRVQYLYVKTTSN